MPSGLDSTTTEHLHNIIKQCLSEVYLEYEPWGHVLAKLALEIADGVEGALKIVGRSGVDGEIPEREAHKGPKGMMMCQSHNSFHVSFAFTIQKPVSSDFSGIQT